MEELDYSVSSATDSFSQQPSDFSFDDDASSHMDLPHGFPDGLRPMIISDKELDTIIEQTQLIKEETKDNYSVHGVLLKMDSKQTASYNQRTLQMTAASDNFNPTKTI